MAELSLNPNWSRIAKLRPQLRQHVHLYAQDYRGERWYVLSDQSSRRHLRFNSAAYAFIGRLDGDLDVESVWNKAVAAQGEHALSQDEVIQILTQLFAVDALKSGLPAEATRFFERFQHEQHLRRKNILRNPLAIRIPLFNPDRLLNTLLPWIRPLFTRFAAFSWFGVVGFAGLLALLNFSALSVAGRGVLEPDNLLSLVVMFIAIKTVHEFAHAFAVKTWGGDVSEMGLTLLVLAPVPYVDASAAWLFRDKRKRMLVGAAGMVAELFVAALALFVWLLVEPGFIKEAAFNLLLIGGVSTVLFNSNPLIRFDGYYILQDWVEIPNLYTRANRYYLYLLQRYLFGLSDQHSPVTAAGEQFWFVVYGLLSFFYRLFILVAIILFLAEKYLVIGVALGVWALVMQVVMPLAKGAQFLASNPKLGAQRVRAVSLTVLAIAGVMASLLFIPVPLTTRAEGVVWVSDQAQIYADTSGFVEEVMLPSGAPVQTGTVIAQMRDPVLNRNIAKLSARHRELQLQIAGQSRQQRVQSDMTKDELRSVDAEWASLEQQAAMLTVRSKVDGNLILPEEWKLKGRYLKQGQLMAYVVGSDQLIVRAVVPQSRIGLVKQGVKSVEVRLAEHLNTPLRVPVVRATPGGSTLLPSRALGAAGGGAIAVDTSDKEGRTAVEKVFVIDLGLPQNIKLNGVGERAYVRFDHGAEPLAYQWFRLGRQLVLSRLSF